MKTIARVMLSILAFTLGCAAQPTQTNVLYGNVGDYRLNPQNRVNVTLSLGWPNPRTFNQFFVRQDPITATSDTNGYFAFTNVIWGAYRVDIAGVRGTSYPAFVGTNTLGRWPLASLCTNIAALPPNTSTNYLTSAQIYALLSALPSGGTDSNTVTAIATSVAGTAVTNAVANGYGGQPTDGGNGGEFDAANGGTPNGGNYNGGNGGIVTLANGGTGTDADYHYPAGSNGSGGTVNLAIGTPGGTLNAANGEYYNDAGGAVNLANSGSGAAGQVNIANSDDSAGTGGTVNIARSVYGTAGTVNLATTAAGTAGTVNVAGSTYSTAGTVNLAAGGHDGYHSPGNGGTVNLATCNGGTVGNVNTGNLNVTGIFTNNGLVWISLKTNGAPVIAAPSGSICTTTNGQFFVRSNTVWLLK